MSALTAFDSVFSPGFLSPVRDERFADDFDGSGRGLQEGGFGEGACRECASFRMKNLPKGEMQGEKFGCMLYIDNDQDHL